MKTDVEAILSRGFRLDKVGVNNWALNTKDALRALEELQAIGAPVLGGDVYYKNGSEIELSYDNWHCDRENIEKQTEFVNRSILRAKEYIESYKSTGGSPPLFALVVTS